MIIQRNQPWGRTAPLPDGAPIAASNAELRMCVSAMRQGTCPQSAIGVIGGDLWRVIGAPTGGAERLRSEFAQTAVVDLITAHADGQTHWACAHVIARSSWLRGPALAAMSTDIAGAWRLAPAAHPNDGRIHVLTTGLSTPCLGLAQRLLARRRLVAGTHVPHPAIALRRVQQADYCFERPLGLWLDGERVGTCRELTVSIEPDAATIVY